MTLAEQKASLRLRIRRELNTVSPDERADASHRLRERIRAWPLFQQARTLLLTASLRDEPDLTPLVEHVQGLGKRCVLPSFDASTSTYVAREWTAPISHLAKGPLGVREPGPDCPEVPFLELDFILVPGVAFDSSGMRLGRGQGHFDRLLRRASRAIFCGVGYDQQIVPAVPVETHDIALHYILTPERVLGCRVSGET